MTSEEIPPPPVEPEAQIPETEPDAQSPPFEPSNFSIALHTLLHNAQQSHGLTHNDYQQYRSYLTNRISRLRHSRPVYKRKGGGGGGGSGSSGGSKKHAFQKREISTEEANNHENFVLIALYTAERAWAHAMELKSSSEDNMNNDTHTVVKRSYYVKRLKKAVKHVEELELMVNQICDDRTQLETKCYAAWMRGNHYCEVRDYQNSCRYYATALQACHNLSKDANAKGELQLSDFFLSRATNILQPLLRYCQYELQQDPGTLTPEDINELVKVDIDADGDNADDEENDSDMNVEFRGNKLCLDDGNIRMAFIKIQNKKNEMNKLKKKKRKGSGGGSGSGSGDAKFMELLNAHDDVTSMVQKMLQTYDGMASGPAVNKKKFEYSSLLGYCKYEKLKLLMERNEKMVNALCEGDTEMSIVKDSNSISTSSGGGVQDDADAKYKRVEEIAHLYDALLQNARAVVALPGGGGDDSHDEDLDFEDEFLLEANANVLRIRALRCYYVGRMYAADAVAKYDEALALFEQASTLATEAAEEIAACQDMDDADALIESMADLEREVTVALCRAKACAYLANRGSGASSATSGMSLLRRLDDFDSGGKTYRLADVPPMLEPIPCKPMFFDIANNYVRDYPHSELQAYLDSKKEETSQKKKGIFGW